LPRSGGCYGRTRRPPRQAASGTSPPPRHGREIVECRFRVTDERGVECPLCGSHTTVAVTCAKAGDGEDSSVSARPDAGGGGEAAGPPTTTSYAIMDDLVVRPIAGGLSGVAADPDDVREEPVPFGYEEVAFSPIASHRCLRFMITSLVALFTYY